VLGIKLYDISLASANAASTLIDLTGGIEAFGQKTDFFYQNFFTAQERAEKLTAEVTSIFESLGFALPTTRDGFKDLFEVIAGSGSASLTSIMLNLAPSIDAVYQATEQLTEQQARLAEVVSRERLGLENQLLSALGNTVELRKREVEQLDESNRALAEQLYMLEDALQAASNAASETDKAMAELEKSLTSRLNTALGELEVAFNSLTQTLNEQINSANIARDLARENLQDLNSIFSLLDGEINNLLRNSLAAQTAAQGSAFISQALVTAQQTGYLPSQSDLSSAIVSARGGLSSENFASSFEQQKATLTMANQLTQLRDLTKGQITTEERTLNVAELQLMALYDRLDQASQQYQSDIEAERSRFDDELATYQRQIDVMRGVQTAVNSVETAIAYLAISIESERGSLIDLQKTMISLQQDANARQAAEIARQEAEAAAVIARQQAQEKAVRDAQIRAENQAAAEAAAAEEARLARVRQEQEAAARAAAAAEAARLAEEERSRSIIGFLVGNFFGFGGDTSNEQVEDTYSFNADGGRFQGGLSMVGEEGPELVNFARPSMIYTAGETADILRGGQSDMTVANEIRSLREENQAQSRALVGLQSRMNRLLERWDGDGLPTERYEDETA
jgi:hypothetical protein